jgi:hypothetical protein
MRRCAVRIGARSPMVLKGREPIKVGATTSHLSYSALGLPGTIAEISINTRLKNRARQSVNPRAIGAATKGGYALRATLRSTSGTGAGGVAKPSRRDDPARSNARATSQRMTCPRNLPDTLSGSWCWGGFRLLIFYLMFSDRDPLQQECSNRLGVQSERTIRSIRRSSNA